MTGLLDVDRLAGWLDARGLEPGLPIAAAPLTGGRSNVMFTIDRGERRWVLRRPAAVAVDGADAGMRREYRILAALGGTGVPHPGVVALCEDPAVLGPVFYLMERLDGVVLVPPPAPLDTDTGRAEVARSMAESLARLHAVDWRGRGLGDLGRPEGFHERQTSRWIRQLRSYEGRELPGVDAVTAWLRAHLPASFTPTLMHGDYHMLNVLIAPDPPGRVVAILDWETATIGDPLLDLAGFCEVWSTSLGDRWGTADQLVAWYSGVAGHLVGDLKMDDLTYHRVLYNFRLAVLLEGIYQRSLRDPTRAAMEDIGQRAGWNLDRARDLVRSSG
ncbi:phosphotransferase family protein [Frankia sp. CNm7]|uniref:Phosphotransferase family protein n=1 Tax=Frankia nepalensis TaxID=1836974 RepID=A0A937RKK0_9ACTN|nr:phosphotransferase family protein [Frankia nepalensis]MBL7502061.1 phosphotransferase family protein [Frankia nepalensis]MBL7511967.1 phosphotransferase family protein [Frankia nepalensis]MBL7524043.1 phosphotransferase family protein [Frankia nepalensis]MBL7630559.1 phosphotransferase family protein [Frankia nepalensis]